jgi:hypothetical protein
MPSPTKSLSSSTEHFPRLRKLCSTPSLLSSQTFDPRRSAVPGDAFQDAAVSHVNGVAIKLNKDQEVLSLFDVLPWLTCWWALGHMLRHAQALEVVPGAPSNKDIPDLRRIWQCSTVFVVSCSPSSCCRRL